MVDNRFILSLAIITTLPKNRVALKTYLNGPLPQIMSEVELEVPMTTNPLSEVELEVPTTTNPLSKRKTAVRSLSRWFVTNQKVETWNKKTLNILHLGILVLMAVAYTCHIVSSPFLLFVEDQNILILLYVIEGICLLCGIACFLKMSSVNLSWTALQLMFSRRSIHTYIFLFWLLRFLIIEILKGQVLYSFVVSFHSALIYITDTWYICDRKILLLSIVMYLVLIIYEFLVSISPFGPKEPKWKLINVETTANSLSCSNYLNLFLIFFDALIIVISDVNRSKYAMLVRKRKRIVVAATPQKERLLKRLWVLVAATASIASICFILSSSLRLFSKISPGLGDILLGTFASISICSYIVVLYHSSGPRSRKLLRHLMHERRVLFILLLLAFLFYVDTYSMNSMLFSMGVLVVISFDFIATYLPRKMGLISVSMVVGVIVWNIINATFLGDFCMKKRPWGLLGEKISDCTIRRLIYQTIMSLLVSAAVAIFAGSTDILFFCNANIYRATGTSIRLVMDNAYVASMRVEKQSSKKNLNPLG